jgi:hypothetical protein
MDNQLESESWNLKIKYLLFGAFQQKINLELFTKPS